MIGEAPDIREEEDCPGGEWCLWLCDQHLPNEDGAAKHDEWAP